VAQQITPRLDLNEIQGDLLIGLQKNAECFVFFKIVDAGLFKRLLTQHVARRITSAWRANYREQLLKQRQNGRGSLSPFFGLNLGFTRDGLTQLLGGGRPRLDPSFERGAEDPATTERLHDPPASAWLKEFRADRIDGILLVTGPREGLVNFHRAELLRLLGGSIKVVYSEMGTTRPGELRGFEHFGYRDGISRPGIRGLTRRSTTNPDQGLPGQDLIWPGEFVFGYPGQDPSDAVKAGQPPDMAAPWLRNGSYMVFRRLEQRVPEFRKFVAERAARLGMEPELLGARMIGRWKSGAPLELAPLHDDWALGGDPRRNNDFDYGDDPFQRKCPYAAHIRKVYPRNDAPGGEAEAQTHRILRAGITFGPEVMPGETTTRHSRGLMFVCYQTSIVRQFEFIQWRHANEPDFVDGKVRPLSGTPVRPGFDPIIGQAAGNGPREMDEPFPNYPAGNRRTTLEIPNQFVVLTAAAYFFMPSLSTLRTVLT
jgi:Dyp-type peroxidase family